MLNLRSHAFEEQHQNKHAENTCCRFDFISHNNKKRKTLNRISSDQSNPIANYQKVFVP
jgi:hypothetical protein